VVERGTVEHVPVIGEPSKQAEDRVHVIFDANTGRRIGHSPHAKVEQVAYTTTKRGVITTTLKITPIKPPKGESNEPG
jgi:hypothetical protein